MPMTEYDPPERFVAGTVGPPGQRTFFLQVRSGIRVTSVSLEKEQVAVLAERIDALLDGLASAGLAAEPGPPDNEPLDVPLDDEFRVVALSLAWDPVRRRIVVECHDGDPEGEEPTASVRVVLTADQARSFARRAAGVVAAGRPPCPFCGGPLDPEGHICPRANGYRR